MLLYVREHCALLTLEWRAELCKTLMDEGWLQIRPL
jgi:hypothetical protein